MDEGLSSASPAEAAAVLSAVGAAGLPQALGEKLVEEGWDLATLQSVPRGEMLDPRGDFAFIGAGHRHRLFASLLQQTDNSSSNDKPQKRALDEGRDASDALAEHQQAEGGEARTSPALKRARADEAGRSTTPAVTNMATTTATQSHQSHPAAVEAARAEGAGTWPQIAAYVPRCVRRQLEVRAEHQAQAGEPWEIILPEAALLMVDISGFTLLTRKCFQDGLAGIEREAASINGYFDQLLSVTERYGGSCLKFAGDAIIILFATAFDGSVGSGLSTAALRATAAALAIQNEAGIYQTPDDIQLTVHCGVAAGSVHCMHLGGVGGEWEFIVAGSPLAELSPALDVAGSGEVALERSLWESVAQQVAQCAGDLPTDWTAEHSHKIGIPGGKTHVRLSNPIWASPVLAAAAKAQSESATEPATLGDEAAAIAAAAYVPEPVLKQLTVTTGTGTADALDIGSWLTEGKTGTIIFVNLPGLRLAVNKPTISFAQGALEKMMSSISSLRGYRRQFLVDDKGTTLIAAFSGLEDDSLRAMRCAFQMVSALTALGIRHTIGVTHGELFFVPFGPVRRRELAILSPYVNCAARLSNQKGFGNLLVCQTTADSCGARLQVGEGRQIEMKGTGLVSVYRALSLQSAKDASDVIAAGMDANPMIGRDAEIAAAMQFATQDGPKNSMLINGAPGTGKSIFLREIYTRLISTRRVFFARSDALEENTPYFSWRPIVDQLFDMDGASSASEVRFRLMEAIQELDPGHLSDAQLLWSHIFGLPGEFVVPGVTLADEGGTGNIRDRLVRLISHIVGRACGGQPVIFLWDDVNNSDPQSRSLLHELAHSTDHDIRVIGTVRDPASHLDLNAGSMFAPDDTLMLVPLSYDSCVAVANMILGATLSPERVTTSLAEAISVSGGIPAILVEMVATERNIQSGASSAPRKTSSFQDFVGSAMSTLPPMARNLMKVASALTFGQYVNAKEVFHVYNAVHGAKHQHDVSDARATYPNEDDSDDDLESDHLRALRACGHLLEVFDGDDLRFSHGIVRDVVYASLPLALRARLHTVAAGVLEHMAGLDGHHVVVEGMGPVINMSSRGGSLGMHHMDEWKGNISQAEAGESEEPCHAAGFETLQNYELESGTLAKLAHHLQLATEADLGLARLPPRSTIYRAHFYCEQIVRMYTMIGEQGTGGAVALLDSQSNITLQCLSLLGDDTFVNLARDPTEYESKAGEEELHLGVGERDLLELKPALPVSEEVSDQEFATGLRRRWFDNRQVRLAVMYRQPGGAFRKDVVLLSQDLITLGVALGVSVRDRFPVLVTTWSILCTNGSFDASTMLESLAYEWGRQLNDPVFGAMASGAVAACYILYNRPLRSRDAALRTLRAYVEDPVTMHENWTLTLYDIGSYAFGVGQGANCMIGDGFAMAEWEEKYRWMTKVEPPMCHGMTKTNYPLCCYSSMSRSVWRHYSDDVLPMQDPDHPCHKFSLLFSFFRPVDIAGGPIDDIIPQSKYDSYLAQASSRDGQHPMGRTVAFTAMTFMFIRNRVQLIGAGDKAEAQRLLATFDGFAGENGINMLKHSVAIATVAAAEAAAVLSNGSRSAQLVDDAFDLFDEHIVAERLSVVLELASAAAADLRSQYDRERGEGALKTLVQKQAAHGCSRVRAPPGHFLNDLVAEVEEAVRGV
jgi:class 3 adenylate cyclase